MNMENRNLTIWLSVLAVVGLCPILLNTLRVGPLMTIAVGIGVIAVLTDGTVTIVLRKANGTEVNPVMNLLFRKVGFRSSLLMTRLVALGLIGYGVISNNPYLILALSWLFLLACLVGLSSLAGSHGGSLASHYKANT